MARDLSQKWLHHRQYRAGATAPGRFYTLTMTNNQVYEFDDLVMVMTTEDDKDVRYKGIFDDPDGDFIDSNFATAGFVGPSTTQGIWIAALKGPASDAEVTAGHARSVQVLVFDKAG